MLDLLLVAKVDPNGYGGDIMESAPLETVVACAQAVRSLLDANSNAYLASADHDRYPDDRHHPSSFGEADQWIVGFRTNHNRRQPWRRGRCCA